MHTKRKEATEMLKVQQRIKSRFSEKFNKKKRIKSRFRGKFKIVVDIHECTVVHGHCVNKVIRFARGIYFRWHYYKTIHSCLKLCIMEL